MREVRVEPDDGFSGSTLEHGVDLPYRRRRFTPPTPPVPAPSPASGNNTLPQSMPPTHRFSRLPMPTRQNPNAHTAATAPKMTTPPGPLIGRFRLYLIDSYPPGGGISLHIVSTGRFSSTTRAVETPRLRFERRGEGKKLTV